MSRSIVIFGASGDLAQNKLLPSLYNQFRKGRLGEDVRIWGTARTDWDDEDFRHEARRGAVTACGRIFDATSWDRFSSRLRYVVSDFAREDDVRRLDEHVRDAAGGEEDSRLYYLATVPALFPALLELLGATGMANEERGFRRVVIEKPFGTDLASARRLNETVHQAFREDQVFRIDHYLAKETVQSILVFRFANVLFEPVWNRTHVEAVHVFVGESVGVGDRAGYYESAGVLRDMFQNHLLQLLTLVALDPPARFNADSLRNEKIKVLQAIEPPSGAELRRLTARGQYEGYRSESLVADSSEIATYGALRLHVDNWRWSGVPFILESGKCLGAKVTTITLSFRRPPLQLFAHDAGSPAVANSITFRLQPNEGVHVSFQTKEPGEGMVLRPVEMDFSYAEAFEPAAVWDAYERLLVDALQGDAALFMRSDEIERAWQIIDPVVQAWEGGQGPPLELYRRGSWGPPGAERVRGGLVSPPDRSALESAARARSSLDDAAPRP